MCAQQSSVETPVSQQVFLFLHIFMHVSVSYCEQCSIERCRKEQNLYRPEGKGQVWLFIGSGILIGDITGCAFSYVLTAHFHIYFLLIFINTGCSFSYGEMPTIVSGALTAHCPNWTLIQIRTVTQSAAHSKITLSGWKNQTQIGSYCFVHQVQDSDIIPKNLGLSWIF